MLERGLSEVQAKSELMREKHGCDCTVCLAFVDGPTLDDSDGESEVGDRDDVDMESGSRWKPHEAANALDQVPLVAAKKSAPIASAAFGCLKRCRRRWKRTRSRCSSEPVAAWASAAARVRSGVLLCWNTEHDMAGTRDTDKRTTAGQRRSLHDSVNTCA